MSWRVAENSLPVLPVVQVRDEEQHSMGILHGMFRSRRTSNLFVQMGCNLNYIPDYCGGMYVTAINVAVRSWAPEWGDNASREMWQSMRSVEDYFDYDAVVRAYESVPQIDGRGGLRTEEGTLFKLGLASLAARIFAASSGINRTSVLAWDTRYGFTRRALRWMHGQFSTGIRYPSHYADWSVERRWVDDPASYNRLLGSVYERAEPGFHTRFPTRSISGMYTHNHNSGNEVGTYTMHITNKRGRGVDDSAPCRINVVEAHPNPAEVAPLAGRGVFSTPHRYYPM